MYYLWTNEDIRSRIMSFYQYNNKNKINSLCLSPQMKGKDSYSLLAQCVKGEPNPLLLPLLPFLK